MKENVAMVTRVGSIALLIAFALALFVGCGQHDTLPPPTPKVEKLVVYSPHPLSTLKPLLTQFETETGITVEVIQGGSGELMDRLEAEKDAPVCDVLWGGMLSTVGHRMELFESYTCINDEAMAPEFRHEATGA